MPSGQFIPTKTRLVHNMWYCGIGLIDYVIQARKIVFLISEKKIVFKELRIHPIVLP
jgi:hypothetical protein